MFSQTKMTGSFQMLARFIDSWRTPWLAAPSPKKEMLTWSVPRTLAPRAAPVATGMLEPTTPLAPSIPLVASAMCIVPPLPLFVPLVLPRSSAIISLRSSPLAMQWWWLRWVPRV